MSTRCTIHFHSAFTGEDRAIVYKHWDGGPDTMEPLLQSFFKWIESKWRDARYEDAAYLAARFVYFLYEVDDNKQDGLGVGIMLKDPSDLCYRYAVRCKVDRTERPQVEVEDVCA